jgi:hypothetical protein
VSAFGGHGAHLALTAGPMAAIAVIAAAADVKARLATRPPRVLAVAAVLSVVAGVVHGVVCPHHFEEATIYGLFFAGATLAQLGWAALVMLKPSRLVVGLGLAGNVAVLALWALTRTVGIPLGPAAGEVEAVGALDLIAGAAELGIAVCAVAWMVSRLRRSEPLPPASPRSPGPALVAAAPGARLSPGPR